MPVKELKDALESQSKAFDKFKKANDDRLAAIEEKGFADPLLEEKVDKANAEISSLEKQLAEIEKKMNRPGGGGEGDNPDVAEHAKAFGQFMRKGREDGLVELEQKALNITTDADGGYAVPTEMERTVLTLMKDESPMRSECTVRQIGSSIYKRPVSLGGAGSGWVDEDDARPETTTPQLAMITPSMGELYANPGATQQMLDDSFFDAEAWLAEEIATKFSEDEAAGFLSGTGVKQPAGILNATAVTTGDATRTFGQLQYVGTAGATAILPDELITLLYTLRKKYRTGAKWMMNSATLAVVRKFKDADNQYLWAPGMQSGQPSTLLGYGVAENEDMPDIATGDTAVMFGNFKRGYLIVDRMGTRTLRDPYTNKPYVHFYTTKRVGGCLLDSNAIKLLQQA